MKNRHNRFLKSKHNIQEKDNRKKMSGERKFMTTNKRNTTLCFVRDFILFEISNLNKDKKNTKNMM